MQLKELLLMLHTQHLVANRGTAYCQSLNSHFSIAAIALSCPYIQASCYRLTILLSHGWVKRVPEPRVSFDVSLKARVAASACAAVPAGVAQPVNIEWDPTAQKIIVPVYSGPCARADFQEE